MGMHLTENTDLYPTPKDAKSLKTSGISKAFDDSLRKTFESALSPRKKTENTALNPVYRRLREEPEKLLKNLKKLSKLQKLELLNNQSPLRVKFVEV